MSTTTIQDGAVVGVEYDPESKPPVLGDDGVVRRGTIMYNDVIAGDNLQTGHNALIREETEMGDDVLVGTNVVVDGTTTIGDHVSLQTGVYIPTQTTIGSNVFVGPRAVLTNDPYPVRQDVPLTGPTLEDGISIGANATILPAVTVGSGSFVAAGALVTEDVPERTLAIGAPARYEPLPENLQPTNDLG